jgi:hypothetical protein
MKKIIMKVLSWFIGVRGDVGDIIGLEGSRMATFFLGGLTSKSEANLIECQRQKNMYIT